MNAEERNTYRMFGRVQEYMGQHPLVDAPQLLGAQLDELTAVMKDLPQGALDQEAGHRQTKAETQRLKGLRQTLWSDHMQPIARVAREIFGTKGVDRALTLPKANVTYEALLAAAGAMAETADKYADEFTKHGLSRDFVVALRQAATDLGNSLVTRVGTSRRKITATADLKANLKRGRRAVRLLNAILEPRLASDPKLLEAWNNARRVKPQPVVTAAVVSVTTPAPVGTTGTAAPIVAPAVSATTQTAAPPPATSVTPVKSA